MQSVFFVTENPFFNNILKSILDLNIFFSSLVLPGPGRKMLIARQKSFFMTSVTPDALLDHIYDLEE